MVLCCAVFLAGCTYEGNLDNFLEDPRSIIQDPHFTDYQEKRDQLESDYLNKKITYVEYVEGMDELDAIYTKEVKERESVIMDGNATNGDVMNGGAIQ